MTEAFVYCWTDHRDNKLYVGSHKGHENDGYICSSKPMLKEYRSRPKDFTRSIIASGLIKDIRKLETEILCGVNAKNDPKFYNQHNADGSFKMCRVDAVLEDTTKQKISLSLKEHNRLNPPIGRPHTEKAKEKMSAIKAGKHISPDTEFKKGQAAWNKGLNYSQETCNKISKSRQGRRWYNNGKTRVIALSCPSGFELGYKLNAY